METMLSEGFGKPGAAPLEADEKLAKVIAEELTHLSDEKLLEVAGLTDFQQRFLARPLMEQVALADADAAEVTAIAEKHGYVLSPV